MEVIPAIDIRGGKCVQLYQGDFRRETVYSESPLVVASRWVGMGASLLHVVDLDGAKSGAPVHASLVAGIASSVTAMVQYGGGIRSLMAARKALSLGVNRIILGTAAIEVPTFLAEAHQEFGPEAVLVSVDARDGYAVQQGWTRKSRISASELINRIESAGGQRFIYTDVARDGTLTEPNFRVIEELLGQTRLKMLVSGGISKVGHLSRLSLLGVEGAIIGTALYAGDINLRVAIDSMGGPELSET